MCGALKRARLVKVGVAEVVFVRKEDAVSAYRKYNNRCLDGECFWQGHTCQRVPGFMASGSCFTFWSMTASFLVKNAFCMCVLSQSITNLC